MIQRPQARFNDPQIPWRRAPSIPSRPGWYFLSSLSSMPMMSIFIRVDNLAESSQIYKIAIAEAPGITSSPER
jgi:hypothetical protein